MQQKSPLLRIWELGETEHRGLIRAIISALIGVLCGIFPYIAAAQVIIGLVYGQRETSYYLMWCSIGLTGYLVRTLLYNLALSMSHKAAFSILKDIRSRVLKKLPKLPLGTVMDTSSGKIKQIIVDQVESMETTLAHLLPEMTSNIAAPVCVLIYLFVLDWRMALLSLVSIPVGMIFMMAIMKGYGKDYEGAVRTTQAMNETIVEYIGGIEVIKAFNQGKNSYVKFSDRVRANAAYYYNWMMRCQFHMSLGYAIAPTTLITVLPVGWLMYSKGSLSIEVFLTCVILSFSIVGPLIAAMSFVDNLAKIGTTVGSVEEILNAEEQQHSAVPVHLGKPDIVLENVSFGYHADQEILHDISLAIPAGTMTALVGPSGGGKSTIAKLIAGFWDVSGGRITLGGVDEKQIPLEQLYDQVAFVTQDNYLFDDTVLENIRMGRLSASDTEVEAAAKAAGCDRFIRGLEKGYDTRVGGGGAHLSGGERQRIAIARAMLKDAPVVILDEATAYIDPENEAIVQKAVANLVQNKTVIVIAHRLSTITGANQIVVVKDGGIEAAGTHEDLLKTCLLYESMWQAHIGIKDGDAA
ncbi:ABC transporter ATP-binding protein [Diplocloster modestus]|uniref:ABC transporter ATP-binding protein/permease n=1 Tax=Diplocloster modestus TaxID=2850322 RepID=A0ABS6KEH0_9FIRM|nr:ABC transporter ATP-binding protein [Diplocloster modestus]MBU9728873.1 ABC transporter ATP-binding protein/permease [Diplocloster modestus]